MTPLTTATVFNVLQQNISYIDRKVYIMFLGGRVNVVPECLK